MSNKYAFIDRDGTLIFEPQDTFQIDSTSKLKVLPGVIEGFQKLKELGYGLIMISNQDGLGTSYFPKDDFEKPQNKMLEIFKEAGIEFEEVFVCPHLDADKCNCRKPKTGLVDDFLKSADIDMKNSFVCGDRESDKKFAENIGFRFIKAELNGSFDTVIDALQRRTASITRKTNETSVQVDLNLDGTGKYDIKTGVGFLDHMLELFSKQSLIDLNIKADGDFKVDEHHTIEDVGIVLGQALKQALGDKKGIQRYGFLLPMDETLAEIALDLGGRPYLVWNVTFKREKIGDMPTELFEDFFKALSDSFGANIHVNLKYGRNEHHMVEAIFKAFARAMKFAVSRDLQAKKLLPSTKGIL